ncbi:protein phosphatase 1 regulatory inhibitor subunit 1C [Nothobranchius furzeri]|uniref:Protein phosphatase 1 regulatory inhibitor subunit 1C n=1 Tax=Nothobranchius furzeri TaxID=105023 RepID=A0A9D3B9C1_NOTFU|nr:protein phosphatase 1 regulatory inhibitor subunit 1C [Nothobranchius furzeri]
MEPGSPKKIQFAVPPLQGQLDPQAAEHVNVGDHQSTSGESQNSDTSQRKQSAYAPPTMKGKLENTVPEEEGEEEEGSSHDV